MDKLNNQALADKMVSNFINNYFETFGFRPKVVYKVDSNIPTLNEIFDLVNEKYQVLYPDKSISDKTKGDLTVKYRALYYSVARYFKYTLIAIGQLTNTDHSTVTHGLKQVSKNSPMKAQLIETLNKKLSS